MRAFRQLEHREQERKLNERLQFILDHTGVGVETPRVGTIAPTLAPSLVPALADRLAQLDQVAKLAKYPYLALKWCHAPARLSADEVTAEVKAIVAELGAKGPGDMGKVMGAVKARLAGKADMGQVSAAVKAALAG